MKAIQLQQHFTQSECSLAQAQIAAPEICSKTVHCEFSQQAKECCQQSSDISQSSQSQDENNFQDQFRSKFELQAAAGDFACSALYQDAESNQKKRPRDYPNWRDISDPEERKKQRRLAKNRATAARSRERKKAELELLQDQNKRLQDSIGSLQQENQALKQHCVSLESQLQSLQAELQQIKSLVASHTSGATVPEQAAGPAESKFTPPTLQLVVLAHLLLRMFLICRTICQMQTFWAMMIQAYALTCQLENRQEFVSINPKGQRPLDPGGLTFYEVDQERLQIQLKRQQLRRFLRNKGQN